MEYQKIANLFYSASDKPVKLRTRNWVEINDDIRGAYSLINKLDLKQQCQGLVYVITVMHIYLLKEVYQLIILQLQVLQQIILINNNVIFKNCALFTNCVSKINNTQKDNEYILI